MSHRKRKKHVTSVQRDRQNTEKTDGRGAEQLEGDLSNMTHPALFIQAYEADLVRGSHARLAAQSLEVVSPAVDAGDGAGRWKVGDGLIRWGGASTSANETVKDHDVISDESESRWELDDSTREAVWVDRYDARLLLERLQSPISHAIPRSDQGSPTSIGWSDMPSDTEDTFFLTPDEAEEYHRDKRRRLMAKNREDRLQALHAMEDESEQTGGDTWGGSDEEPDDMQKTFMRKTATHLFSSPKPALLEMRILANHGADARFAFLRGRWSHSWKSIKAEVSAEIEKARAPISIQTVPSGLRSLEGYGDSEDDTGDERETGTSSNVPEAGEASKGVLSEDGIKAARRERAKEWARKRRALELDDS